MYPPRSVFALYPPSNDVIRYMAELADYGFNDWDIMGAGIRRLINPDIGWGEMLFDSVTDSYKDDLRRYERDLTYQKAASYFSGYDQLHALLSATVDMVTDDYLPYRGLLLCLDANSVLVQPDHDVSVLYVEGTCVTQFYWTPLR